jgi:hypothetical protein
MMTVAATGQPGLTDTFWCRESFFILGTAYTALVFIGIRSKERAVLFTRRNNDILLKILLTHMVYLLIILVAFELSPLMERYLPRVVTDETLDFRGGTFSFFEIAFVAAMGVLHLLERRRICAIAGANEFESG